jgi:4-amino-4-deoxy-L-arabinose transferase-like glycosyltransferase
VQLYRKSVALTFNKYQRFLIQFREGAIPLIIIVLLALCLRFLAMPLIPNNIGLDNPTYLAAASDIIKDGVITSHSIMPLYPLTLAIFGANEKAVILVGMLTGIISVVLVGILAWSIFGDRKIAFAASTMMAFYPMSIFYSIKGLTESLFVMLILCAFVALYKNKLIWASTFFVLSILTRPVMDIFSPFVIFWHALVIRKTGILYAFRDLTVYGIIYVILMSPWWYHNVKKYDQFVRLNYGFGVTLYAGNNPMNQSGGGIGGFDYIPDGAIQGKQLKYPYLVDSVFQEVALKYIRQYPSHFIKMAGIKFIRFWRLIPYTPIVQSNPLAKVTTLSLFPLILLAIATLITRRNSFKKLTPLLGFIAYLTLIHMITIGSIRYRFPLEPLMIVIAAPSLILVYNYIFGKRISTQRSKMT